MSLYRSLILKGRFTLSQRQKQSAGDEGEQLRGDLYET